MSDEAPTVALRRLVNGYQVTQAIHVAATLGIADLLGEGPRGSEELASQTSTHAPSLQRVLRALAAVGVLDEDDGGRFALTEIGNCLRSDVPEPVGGWAAFVGRPDHFAAWSHLLQGVRTGETPFELVHGCDVWQYRNRHPEDSAIFDRAMTDITKRATRHVLEAYDFERFASVLDVGGGRGAFVAALLSAYPEMRGAVLDLPHVVAEAQPLLDAAGVGERCELIAGSFFDDALPHGRDAYVLKAVLHDWDDEDAVRIVRACRDAAAATSALLVIERDLGPPNANADAKLSDLNMLVDTGGRERSGHEFAALLSAGGFALERVVPTAIGVSVFEARPG